MRFVDSRKKEGLSSEMKRTISKLKLSIMEGSFLRASNNLRRFLLDSYSKDVKLATRKWRICNGWMNCHSDECPHRSIHKTVVTFGINMCVAAPCPLNQDQKCRCLSVPSKTIKEMEDAE
jgi:hypothetical protein